MLMDATGGVMLLFISVIFFAIWKNMRRKQVKILAWGYAASATVKEYRSEYVRVAGSWSWLNYPYVTYQDNAGVCKTERLKHAASGEQEFFIGQLIEVVHFDSVLYYRPDLESWGLSIIGMATGAFLFGLTGLIPVLAHWLNL